jgi:tRNA G46 methylase TrmB
VSTGIYLAFAMRPPDIERWLLDQLDFVELDVGSGDGEFLCNLASCQPDRKVVGVEVVSYRHLIAEDRLERNGIGNAHSINEEAYALIRRLRTETIAGAHIYFPTPDPESIGLEGRLVSGRFVEELHRVLQKGGFLRFATDHYEYYREVLSMLDTACWAARLWSPLPTRTHDLRINTGCERLYKIEMQQPVYYLQAVRI